MNDFPNARPESFAAVRSRLPNPRRVEVRPGLALDTLHCDGDGPPVVFVHGGLSNLWIWFAQLDAFYGDREMLAYSMAGNGRSDDRECHTVEGHVLDLADLLRRRDVEEPIVVGWSYGTVVALEYAKRFPVGGVLLTGGGAMDLTPRWEKPMMQLAIATRLYRLPSNPIVKVLAEWVAVDSSADDEVVSDVLDANGTPRRRSAWTMVPETFWGYDGRYDLDQLTVPTMVVHGATDRIVPWRVAERTAALLPDAECYRFERTGHALPAERPCPFDELLVRLCTAVEEGEWPDERPDCVEEIAERPRR